MRILTIFPASVGAKFPIVNEDGDDLTPNESASAADKTKKEESASKRQKIVLLAISLLVIGLVAYFFYTGMAARGDFEKAVEFFQRIWTKIFK